MINRHFDPYNLLMDRQSRTLLVLNPKVMTTFCRVLYCDGLHEFREQSDPSEGRWKWYPRARSFPVPSLRDFVGILNGATAYTVYGIARNPFRRVLSGWKDKFYDPHVSGGGAAQAYPRSMRQGELANFRRAARKLGLAGSAEGELVTFDTFLKIIAQQREGRRNHHWDTQVSVMQFQHFSFSQVFRIEDERDEAFVEIFGRMGFAPDWILGRLAKPLNKSSGNVAGYTAEQAELVANIFAKDFATFCYKPECPEELLL